MRWSVGAGLMALALGGCATMVGDVAPDWELSDTLGARHHLSSYSGNVVVLEFWATWCAPCHEVTPVMQALHERYGERGLTVLGIHYNSEGDPAGYRRDRGLGFPILVDGLEVARAYGVSKIPAILVISRDGVVVHRQTGFAEADAERLEALIAATLRI